VALRKRLKVKEREKRQRVFPFSRASGRGKRRHHFAKHGLHVKLVIRVLQHDRHRGEKRLRVSLFAAKQEPALHGLREPSEKTGECRFPSAVMADHRGDPGVNAERRVIKHRGLPLVGKGNGVRREHRAARCLLVSRQRLPDIRHRGGPEAIAAAEFRGQNREIPLFRHPPVLHHDHAVHGSGEPVETVIHDEDRLPFLLQPDDFRGERLG